MIKLEEAKAGKEETNASAEGAAVGVPNAETGAQDSAAGAQRSKIDVLDLVSPISPPLRDFPPISSPTVHRPSETVVDSGIYNIVDLHGTYLNHQEACIENQDFPVLTDPRAHGYVLYRKTRHKHPPQKIFLPGDKVKYSGIYDVVDEDGIGQNHQYTFVAGTVFPAPVPHAYGYALAERASYMARIYRPGDSVQDGGAYDVVDREGMPIGQQISCFSDSTFPAIAEPNAYGYMRQ